MYRISSDPFRQIPHESVIPTPSRSPNLSEPLIEKKDSASSEPAFYIRPVRSQDSEAIVDLFQRTSQHSIHNTRDEVSSFEKTLRMVSHASQSIPDILFLVAVRIMPPSAGKAGLKRLEAGGVRAPGHGVLGFASLIPFTGGLGHGPRSCYNRTASMVIYFCTVRLSSKSFTAGRRWLRSVKC